MAEALNPADWGATPVADGPQAWGAVPVESQSSLPAALADVPAEIKNAASENVAAIRRGLTPSGQGERGFLERSADLGRAIVGIPGLALSPVTGAVRSVGGHLMADAEHAVGTLIAPELAAKDNPQKMYETAKGDIDLAMAGARPAVPAAPTIKAPTIPELKAASGAAYSSPEVVGLEIRPGTLKRYSDEVGLNLNKDGFDDIVAPKTFALLKRVQDFPPDAVVTGQNLNSLRKTFGKLAGSTDPTEKAAASIAIDHLDDFIPTVGAGDILKGDAAAAAAKLEEARGNYAAAKQSEKLDKKIQKSEMQADVANSGMNLENRIRANMGKIAIDEREARGLTAGEVDQARKIAQGTPTQNAMRAAGNMLGGGGGLGAVITGIPTAGIAPAAHRLRPVHGEVGRVLTVVMAGTSPAP